MAAIAKLRATKQPPIAIKPNILYEDYPTTAIYNSVVLAAVAPATNTTTVTRKQVLPFCPDASDKERLIRCFHDLVEASGANNLSLADSALHQKAREVLGGELKTTWTAVVATAITANKAATTDFEANVREFLANYMPPNSYLILTESLTHASKPFSMDCFEVISRLRLINILSPYLPGSGGKKILDDDVSLKSAFYRLMLPQWQLNFDAAGHQIDDATLTVNRLVSFMDQQRLHHDAHKDLERRQQPRNPRAQRRSTPYNGYNNNRSYGNSNPRPNNFSSPYQNRPNRFNQSPMRSFRPSSTSFRPASSSRTPVASGNNQRAVTRSNQPTGPHTRSRGPPRPASGRGAARQLSFYSGRGRSYPRRSDNYYAQSDNYYQEEPHDHHTEDGFFNQDYEQQEDHHNDGFFNQDTEHLTQDGFFNQDDGFFNQDSDDHFNHEYDDMFHQDDQLDHFEAQASA